MQKNYLYSIIFILTVLLTGSHLLCTKDIAGAGSETTNGITGSVYNAGGTAAVASIVKLLPSDFNRTGKDTLSDRSIDTTDSNGIYHFSDVAPGSYNVIMRDTDRKTCCKIDSIIYQQDDTLVSAPPGNLTSSGAIRIVRDETALNGTTSFFIPGTDVSTVTDDTIALLDNVPEGVIPEVYSLSGDTTPQLIGSDIQITPNDTVSIVNPSWRYVQSIYFNTTSTGALLEQSLYDFPVLVRLTEDDFQFSEAHPEGNDIRFTKADGTDLSFEIAQWDSAAQRADIWISLDTLPADSILEIRMYWGNGDAAAATSSSAVFAAAHHFEGVWHLDDSSGDTVIDASDNGYDGIIMNGTSVTFSDGMVGRGCSFDGSDGYIQMPGTANSSLSFPQNGEYTVSTWVYIEEADNNTHVIVSKGNCHYFLYYTSIHTNSPLWEFTEYQNGTGWELSATDAEGGAWHYLAGVRNGTEQFLYLDGILVDSVGFVFDATASSDHTYDLVIGRFLQDFVENGYCFFEGIIDEVRIGSTARSSDWIRLCYENQKPENGLVSFIKP